MLIQTLEYLVSRDLFLILRVFAIFMIFYMAIQTGKRIRETRILSATTGFTIFLISFGLFSITTAIPDLYPEFYDNILLIHLKSLVLIIGMVFFILFVELDEALHSPKPTDKKFKYSLTIISLIGVLILYPITFYLIMDSSLTFVFLVIPFIIAIRIFLIKFQTLQIVKQSKPTLWFFIGLLLAGLSNFLYSPAIFPYLGYWVSIITSICILIGAFMMTHSWSRLPSLNELDWMLKMERLMVIHLTSSGLMFQYEFQTISEQEKSEQVESDLAGSAIGGVNLLLKEILASDGHIKEIDHGDKKIIFTQGVATACILITSGHSKEFRYRLEVFQLSFEKKFKGEQLINWTGEVRQFSKASDLILNHFS